MAEMGEWEHTRYEARDDGSWAKRDPTLEEIAGDVFLNEIVKQKVAKMMAEVTLELLPGIKLIVDTDQFTIENNLSLDRFSESADIKVYVDVRMVDVISKEQSKAESIVILRTK